MNVQSIGFIDQLDLGPERNTPPRFCTRATAKIELPLTEVGKAVVMGERQGTQF